MIPKTHRFFISIQSLLLSKTAFEPNHGHHHFNLHQFRSIVKVRLKWVKNRSLDHIIDRETDLKAACLLKDAIKRSPTGFLTAKSFADWHKLLGLTIPVLRFLRRFLPFSYFILFSPTFHKVRTGGSFVEY